MFASKSSLNKIENIQKRALRFVCNDFVSNYSEHYCDIIMGTMASQITSLMIVYLTIYSDAD